MIYAWEHPGVPVDEVLNDVLRAFHHPAIRDENVEIQRNMFNTVRRWVDENPERGNLDSVLSSTSVKAGKNHTLNTRDGDNHNLFRGLGEDTSSQGPAWSKIISRDLGEMQGSDGNPAMSYLSTSPRAGSPASPRRTPDYGYDNNSSYAPPPTLGSPSLRPDMTQGYGGYQQGPPPMSYQPYNPPVPYQQGPPGGVWPQGGPAYQEAPGYRAGPPPMAQPPYGASQYPAPGYPYGAQPNQYP